MYQNILFFIYLFEPMARSIENWKFWVVETIDWIYKSHWIMDANKIKACDLNDNLSILICH